MGMRSKVFFALTVVLFLAGWWLARVNPPHHFVAAGFCLFGGFGSFVRAIVVLGDGDRVHHPKMQRGF